MTEVTNLRMLADSQPSLCIPRVFNNITEARIRQVFDELRIGSVRQIDIKERQNEKGESFKRVYIHFNEWYWNEDAQAARRKLVSGKEVKIVYDNPWFWKVSASKWTPSSEKPAHVRPHIEFDEDDRRPDDRRRQDDRYTGVSNRRPDDRYTGVSDRRQDDKYTGVSADRRPDDRRRQDDRYTGVSNRRPDDRRPDDRRPDDRRPDDRQRGYTRPTLTRKSELPIAPTLPLPIAPALSLPIAPTLQIPYEPRTPPTSPTHVDVCLDDADAPEYADFKIDYGVAPAIPKRKVSKKTPKAVKTELVAEMSEDKQELCDELYGDM